jgi:Lysozyme like domain
MSVLSYAQLKAVWLSAAKGTQYATNAWASLMAAIAEAESSGNTDAYNPTDNGGSQTSWGLWQISLGNHDEPSPNWNNPIVNAQLAIQKLEGQGLSAWGTYTSGAYEAYLNGATTPDGTGITGGSVVEAAYLTSASAVASNCLWAIPSLGGIVGSAGGGFIGGIIGGITGNPSAGVSGLAAGGGGYCIFSKSEARALAGAGFLIGGGLIMLWGVNLVVAVAALKAAGRVVSVVTGAKGTASRAAGLFGGGAAAGAGAEGAAAGAGAADVAVLAA